VTDLLLEIACIYCIGRDAWRICREKTDLLDRLRIIERAWLYVLLPVALVIMTGILLEIDMWQYDSPYKFLLFAIIFVFCCVLVWMPFSIAQICLDTNSFVLSITGEPLGSYLKGVTASRPTLAGRRYDNRVLVEENRKENKTFFRRYGGAIFKTLKKSNSQKKRNGS